MPKKHDGFQLFSPAKQELFIITDYVAVEEAKLGNMNHLHTKLKNITADEITKATSCSFKDNSFLTTDSQYFEDVLKNVHDDIENMIFINEEVKFPIFSSRDAAIDFVKLLKYQDYSYDDDHQWINFYPTITKIKCDKKIECTPQSFFQTIYPVTKRHYPTLSSGDIYCTFIKELGELGEFEKISNIVVSNHAVKELEPNSQLSNNNCCTIL